MKALGTDMSKVYAMSWIGLSLVQFIVENSYIDNFLQIMCAPGIGADYVENFDPLSTESYRRTINKNENANEIALNKFIARAAKTSINSGNLTVTAKFMMALPPNFRGNLREKIIKLSGARAPNSQKLVTKIALQSLEHKIDTGVSRMEE